MIMKPFVVVHPTHILMYPRVHRAHWLKSTGLADRFKVYHANGRLIEGWPFNFAPYVFVIMTAQCWHVSICGTSFTLFKTLQTFVLEVVSVRLMLVLGNLSYRCDSVSLGLG